MLAQAELGSWLLAATSASDFERSAPRATVVDLERGVDLMTPLQVITHCWFPLSGLLSVIAIDEDGGGAEIGLVGVDGMADWQQRSVTTAA